MTHNKDISFVFFPPCCNVGLLAKPVVTELSPSNGTVAYAKQAILQCVVQSPTEPEIKVRGQGQSQNIAVKGVAFSIQQKCNWKLNSKRKSTQNIDG